MKQRSLIVLRPISFFLFLVVVVLSLAALLITIWFEKVSKIEEEVKLLSHNIDQEFISEIHNAAAFYSPNNASSSINLGRILNLSLDGNDLRFPDIVSKVAPALFQAYSTIPYISQISYISLNGLFFSYYKERDEPHVLYSNSTFSSRNGTKKYTWYLQPSSHDTGDLHGDAVEFPAPRVVQETWFQEALNSTKGYASVGTGWKNPQEVLLLSTSRLNGNGAVSLGFRMQPMIDFLIAKLASADGSFLYLVTRDWNVAIKGFPNVKTILNGDNILFQLLNSDDQQLQTVGNFSCQSNNGELRERDNALSFEGKKYFINCLKNEIAGIQFVYVLAIQRDEHLSRVHNNIRLSFALLLLMVGAVVITICIFVALVVEAARREMFLCNALINQMESTQQSERKSMNKSLAFASASHDIRASLAGISGLIDVCRGEVTKREPRRSEVEANLMQMEACTRDLLGILNCILDTSKIEAGKMQLEEEEFDVEELLEDVVNLYHPIGMKKGVDVILDPCDGSMSRCCRAKGDRTKLKQILSNLLSNAVKFTSEGHITVGAWAKKTTLKTEMLGSTQSNWISRLFCLLFKIHRAKNETESTNGVQRDRDLTDYTFEVNDTGKGIPREKRDSVFENYIQVKESSLGHQGTGLGLGIVQSLVRLMGGEIGIVEKEVGETGTCFRFNVLLMTGDVDSYVPPQHSGLLTHVQSPRGGERSQVVLLVKSEQRSRALQAYMQRLGIKVYVVKQHVQLGPALRRIKQKVQSTCSYSSSCNSSTRSSVPLSSLEGTDDLSRPRPKNHPNPPQAGFVLMVIDSGTGPFSEMRTAVSEFRKDLNERCCTRVIWLDVGGARLDEDELAPQDLVISKPFHGSRLYQAIALLPEFGGVPPRRGQVSASESGGGKEMFGEIEEVGGKPLMGKKIMVVDDDAIGRKIAMFIASQLGAASVCCENGAAAFDRFSESLQCGTARFDCILMDCEMPVMDGSEATVRIREAERGYGVRTMIVGLSAHKEGEEVEKMMEAGVDAYITKPLNKHNLLNTLSQLTSTV